MIKEGVLHNNGWSKATPVRAVRQVIRKLADGVYPTEPTLCPCGGKKETKIVDRERHTIPHRMVMCENCCLIRANPRMTKEAYEAFYNDEYRLIYDGFQHQDKANDRDFLFEQQLLRGRGVKDFIERICETSPKCVVDFGCDKGGNLMPYHEEGIEVHGIEICDEGREYTEKLGIQTVRTIDELIGKGVKADLVIMQDVVEHLLGFDDLCKVSKILAKDGLVFIYTPGVLTTDPAGIFQNAHTYQFIAATLQLYMAKIGYEAEFLDERIVSVWRFTGEDSSDDINPRDWRRYLVSHFLNEAHEAIPPIRTHCKFKVSTMLDNLKANLPRKIPTMRELKDTESGDVVIVGGGPSVDNQIDEIKRLVGEGKKLLVIERMYEWCHLNGLHPDYVAALDASDDVKDNFNHIQDGTIHFLVATIHPDVFDNVPRESTYLWSGSAGLHPEAHDIWRQNGYTNIPVINTGGSVTLGSMFLSLVLGFRNIHMFGFDCMMRSKEKGYASGVTGVSMDRDYFEVEVDGDVVYTCSSFLSFSQQFFRMVTLAKNADMLDDIQVYGDSLVNMMWDKKAEKEYAETEKVRANV